jgi:hypothetical protein
MNRRNGQTRRVISFPCNLDCARIADQLDDISCGRRHSLRRKVSSLQRRPSACHYPWPRLQGLSGADNGIVLSL